MFVVTYQSVRDPYHSGVATFETVERAEEFVRQMEKNGYSTFTNY